MFDFGAIGGAIDAIKKLSDLVKGIKGLVEGEKIALDGRIIEAQQLLLATQAQMFAIQEEVRELKSKLMEADDWKAQRDRYQMVKFASGSIAFAIKPDAQGGQPPHHACPACYQKRRISFMQGNESETYGNSLTCPECKLELHLDPVR